MPAITSRLTFTAAVWWCEVNGATWKFAPSERGDGFELRLRVGREEIVEHGAHATDWGWMLVDAVERYCRGWEDERPTTPTIPPRFGW